jgi:4-carboxymuconolactone decarboxylase
MSNRSNSSRIAEIPAEQLSPEQADIVNRLISGRGRIPTPFKIWLHSPELAGVLQPLGDYLARPSTLTARETKIAILFMAVHWHARYVFDAHAREARGLGVADEVIEAIGAGQTPLLVESRERAIYELVTQLNGFESPADGVFRQAVQELGHGGLADLLALCGYFTAVSLATKLYRV